MTAHNFGSVVGLDDEGIFALGDAVLFTEATTLAVDSLSGTQRVPVIVLDLAGRLNKSEDTLRAAYVLPVLDAGMVCGMLAGASKRLGLEEQRDFAVGFALGLEK